MNEIGYKVDLTLSFDELSLFLGGQADIAPSVGTIEAASLGTEQDQQLTAHALQTPQHTGWFVRKGSDYDPSVAGSKQAAIDRIIDDGANIAIGGWGLGDIPAEAMIFDQKYGYDFSQGGDFNVVTASLPSIAQLVTDEQVAMGVSAPPYGFWGERDELANVYWNQEELAEIGFHRLTVCISNGITRTEFAQEHREAVEAYFGLERFSAQYFRDNISDLASRSELQETLNLPSQEAAEYVLDFRYKAENSPNQYPATLIDNNWTDDRIKRDKEALRAAQEVEQVPSGWEEYVSYQQHDTEAIAEKAAEYL
jgi:hypothetical protein